MLRLWGPSNAICRKTICGSGKFPKFLAATKIKNFCHYLHSTLYFWWIGKQKANSTQGSMLPDKKFQENLRASSSLRYPFALQLLYKFDYNKLIFLNNFGAVFCWLPHSLRIRSNNEKRKGWVWKLCAHACIKIWISLKT